MDSGLDFSRTVGWFTSVFPVRLDLQDVHLQSMDLQRIAFMRHLPICLRLDELSSLLKINCALFRAAVSTTDYCAT